MSSYVYSISEAFSLEQGQQVFFALIFRWPLLDITVIKLCIKLGHVYVFDVSF